MLVSIFFFFAKTTWAHAYISRSCGADETCVLCFNCYNPEDHTGHQVIIDIIEEERGGICDCGDPEAWVKDFPCRHSSLENFVEGQPINSDLEDALLATIRTAIDFVVDVLSTADIAMQRFSSASQVIDLEKFAELSEEVYGMPDKDLDFEAFSELSEDPIDISAFDQDPKYVLTIWNDERHSFPDVHDMVTNILGRDRIFAEELADSVNNYGRGFLKMCTNLEDLMILKGRMESDGLIHTVRSARSNYKEEMCDCIIHWLEDISTSSINGNYLILSELVAKALCEPWRIGVTGVLSEVEDVANLGLEVTASRAITRKNSSSLVGATIAQPGTLPLQFFTLEQPSPQVILSKAIPPPPACWLNDVPEPPNFSHAGVGLRVQYLMYFDVRLWKSLRATLRDLYNAALVSNTVYKPILANCYAQIYPTILETYLLIDREPDCSIVHSLSTQLFTTPSIATNILSSGHFSKHLATIHTFFTKGRVGSVECVDVKAVMADDSPALKNKMYYTLFSDLEFLLNQNTNKQSISGNVSRIEQVCDLLRLFQGGIPMKRQVDFHVEYETNYANYLSCIALVLGLANTISRHAFDSDPQQVHLGIKAVTKSIYNWAWGKSGIFGEIVQSPPRFRDVFIMAQDRVTNVIRVPELRVEEGLVSLHHPLHAFLSGLLRYGGVQNLQQLKTLLSPDSDILALYPHITTDDALHLLFDYNFRVFVVFSQIKVGLWVRNGFAVKAEMMFYRDKELRDNGFMRDIFMAQTAITVLGPETCMARILERWGLAKGYIGPLSDRQQQLYMLEDLVHHLIVFLTERRELIGLSEMEAKEGYITAEIIQCLGFHPLSFSEISEAVSGSIIDEEMFETILSKISTFRPPVGIRNSGIYKLKPEYMHCFDPFYFTFTPAKMEEAENVLKEFHHKQTKQSLEKIVLEPIVKPILTGPFITIGAFTRTAGFANFVHRVLSFVLQEEEGERGGDTLLSLVLRLCHIAALDDLNMPLDGSPTFVSAMCESSCPVPRIMLRSVELGDALSTAAILLLNEVSLRSEFSKHKPQIIRIFHLLKTKNSIVIPDYVNANLNCGFLLPSEDQGLSKEIQKKNEKKRLFMRKQKKVLAQMQKQQKKFAHKNKVHIIKEDDDERQLTDEYDEQSFPQGQCILCRTPCDSKSVFGILANFHLSSPPRTVPFDDNDWVYEAYSAVHDLDKPEPDFDSSVGSDAWNKYRKNFREKNKLGPGYPTGYAKARTVISSCCHPMHESCYESHVKAQIERFPPRIMDRADKSECETSCPLCLSLNNTFIPVLWTQNSPDLHIVLASTQSFEDFSKHFLRKSAQLPENCITDIGKKLAEVASQSIEPEYATLLGFHPDDSPVSDNDEEKFEILFKRLMVVAHNMSNKKVTNKLPTTYSLSAVFSSITSTISALEISLRGSVTLEDVGGTVIDQIPTLSLQLLRVLVEYCRTLCAFYYSPRYDIEKKALSQNKDFTTIFKSSSISYCDDGFAAIAENIFLRAHFYRLDTCHFFGSYFIGEIVRSATIFLQDMHVCGSWVQNPLFFEIPTFPDISLDALSTLETVLRSIHAKMDHGSYESYIWSHPKTMPVLYTMILKSVTPFLRKCAILVRAMCGTGYATSDYLGYAREADKLCMLLRIPTFDATLVDMTGLDHATCEITNRWLTEFRCADWPNGINLEYPGVVKLLHLPQRLDEFFSLEVLRQKSENDLYTTTPALCLFCGTVVQLKHTVQECADHSARCSYPIGIFLFPKKALVYLINGQRSTFMAAPYLDSHGESDAMM